MARPKNNAQRIPSQPTVPLSGNLGTSGTSPDTHFRVEPGTASVPPGYTYVPAPPPKSHPEAETGKWSTDRIVGYIGGVVGIIVVLITVVLFFSGMSRDLSDIKLDVKNGDEKLGQLMEKADKNSYDLQSLRDQIHGDMTITRRK